MQIIDCKLQNLVEKRCFGTKEFRKIIWAVEEKFALLETEQSLSEFITVKHPEHESP
jgi:hypothetical protein